MENGNAKQQVVEAIKANSNILVTVSDSPSVDELSAALGLTILFNKLEKRATSVFSGAIPPAITFLDPEKTFEGTVDSLRDFIIALDKEKADHLRYKVDGDVVKIFITPYRTTLTDKDLQFTQGDYNVELVVALGVRDQDHLDKALSAHGRILHDATVVTISAGADPSSLGSIDWRDAAASSLSEMLVGLSESLKDEQPLLDEQIATAFLTGIVSATDRFSNDRTSSRVMTMAAQLMAAGANQQLIAAKLQAAHDIGPNSVPKDSNAKNTDGTTTIAEDKPTKVDKSSKKDKKSKRDETGLTIERDDTASTDEKPADSTPPQDDQQAVAEAVAVEEALQQADPAKDVERELAGQLAEVVAEPQTTLPPADLEQELNQALEAEPQANAPLPEITPALTALSDPGMPDFEALDVPDPIKAQDIAPPAPEPEPVGAIESRPGSSYVSSEGTANFDAPVDGLLSNTNEAPDVPVDPFSVPLPPLPDLHESKDVVAPFVDEPQPAFDAPANVTVDAPTPTLDDLVGTTPPLPPTDAMPPLPPLPDFSTLPPLPTPPLPPAFDQPSAAQPQSGAISADKLGDIFGDTTAAPVNETPAASAAPPPPGQFRIPGQ
jgi:hypothetical protein